MSEKGQKLPLAGVRAKSVDTPTTDIAGPPRHVGSVPTCDIKIACGSKEKPPEGGSSIQSSCF
jgi:hypothetical protein